MSIENDRRVHEALRQLVDDACEGILPCIADKIRDATRKAYYLGCADGVSFAKEPATIERRDEDEKLDRVNHLVGDV